MIEKSLFQFCGKSKKYIFQTVFINCIRLVANIVFSFAFASIMTELITGSSVIEVKYATVLIVLSLIVRQLCIKVASDRSGRVVREVKHNLRSSIYRKVLSMGSLYQEKLTTQEIVHLGVEGVEQLESYFGLYLPQFYYCFASTIILFAVILPINVKIAAVLLILSPVIPGLLVLILKMVKKVQKRYWSKYADVGNLFLDSLQGLTTLKVFRADEHRGEELDEMAEGFRKETMKVLSMQLNSIMVIDWVGYGGAVAGVITALIQFSNNAINIYEMVVVLLLIADFFVPMRQLTSFFHVAMTGVTASEKMLDFLNSEDGIEYGKEEYPVNSSIEVENMDYYYGDKTHALKNINMTFEAGKMTALVGPSGCGKSTLASLIAGEYIPPKNSILYGGKDIFSMKKGEINKNVARITHDGHVFMGTVRSNLLLGNPEAEDAELIDILKKVSLWEVFSQMDGLDTEVLSQGKNLSGGQAQRLSLARALLHNAQVYIFDEATSNIDIESEEIILGIIEEISKKKTVIYISHRLQSVKNADRIYVMEHGNLIQEGIHETLINEDGMYRNLYKGQEELEKYRSRGKEEDR